MYYLYILYSQTFGIYYIGQSHDPWERLKHHNTDDKDTFTFKYRPWNFIAVFEVGTRAEAMKAEKFIKKQKSKTIIEKLADPGFVPTGSLAHLVRVPHVRD